jgi:hypothetical protein
VSYFTWWLDVVARIGEALDEDEHEVYPEDDALSTLQWSSTRAKW